MGFISKGINAARNRTAKFLEIEVCIRPFTKKLGFTANENTYIASYLADRSLNGNLHLHIKYSGIRPSFIAARLYKNTHLDAENRLIHIISNMRNTTLVKYKLAIES